MHNTGLVSPGQITHYKCRNNHTMSTIVRYQGNCMAEIDCSHPNCKHKASITSTNTKHVKSASDYIPPDFEWIQPTKEQIAECDDKLLRYYLKGGLKLVVIKRSGIQSKPKKSFFKRFFKRKTK